MSDPKPPVNIPLPEKWPTMSKDEKRDFVRAALMRIGQESGVTAPPRG